MSSRLQEARWFVRILQQRFDTILRVSKAIVERQKAFFTHGGSAMKPLVLREIARNWDCTRARSPRVTRQVHGHRRKGPSSENIVFGSSLNTEGRRQRVEHRRTGADPAVRVAEDPDKRCPTASSA